MNEPENVLRNFEKPVLKRQAEEENGTKKIKNTAKRGTITTCNNFNESHKLSSNYQTQKST